MSFTAAKPGGWAFGEILRSAQMNQLDTDHVNSIDKAAGDTCTPTAPINFKGKGISVGTAIGDDTYLSTANAKWVAPAMDFAAGPTVGIRMVDLCAYAEGMMLAVASNATDKIAVSLDDGFSWTDKSSSISSPQTITLQCCAAKTVPTVSTATMLAGGNSAKVYYSLDASTWAFVTCPGTPTNIEKLHYHAGLDLFIGIGHTAGAEYIVTITSSIVATQRTVPGSITGTNIGKAISQAVSGAHSGRLVISWASKTKVAWSDDAVTWTASTTSLTSGDYLHAFGDGVWLAVSTSGTNIYTSTDGDTWTTSGVTYPSGVFAVTMAALNGVFVVVDTANIFWFSVDKGATWRPISCLYLNYNFQTRLRTVGKRLHCLQTDGTNALDMRSRRFGFTDGVW